MNVTGMSCCAVAEISYLTVVDDAEAAAESLWQYCVSRNPLYPEFYSCRYAIFTQARGTDDQRGYGFTFADFLRNNNLGEVIDSVPAGINPNSRNDVKMWIWIVDRDRMTSWIAAERKRRNYVHTGMRQAQPTSPVVPPGYMAVAAAPPDPAFAQAGMMGAGIAAGNDFNGAWHGLAREVEVVVNPEMVNDVPGPQAPAPVDYTRAVLRAADANRHRVDRNNLADTMRMFLTQRYPNRNVRRGSINRGESR